MLLRIVLLLVLGLSSCATKTVYQYNTVTINDCNGTKVEIKTADTQPTDIGRGLTASIPAF